MFFKTYFKALFSVDDDKLCVHIWGSLFYCIEY